MTKHLGLIYALSAYFLWGLVPIYWKQIDHISAQEIVANRMVWACFWVIVLILFLRQWNSFIAVFKDRATLFRLTAASLLVSVNWGIYIWAVIGGHIVETSLGYFINPLITVLFGLLLFGESLRRNQIIALVLAGVGVAGMVIVTGGLPWISLSLAVSFALYGVMKKKVSLPASHGMAIETLVVFIPATIYLSFLHFGGVGHFAGSMHDSLYLLLGGLVTLVPLLLFAAAAKRVSMMALGMTQYIGPTCQLLVGVFLYQEPFALGKILAFGFIWVALFVYSVDELNQQRIRRRLRRA